MSIDDPWYPASDDLRVILNEVETLARKFGGSPAAVRRATKDIAKQVHYDWLLDLIRFGGHLPKGG
jgi:hypothetical protein